MKKTREDFALSAVIAVVMTVVVVLTLYPFLNILAISLNDARDATAGGISLWPRKFSLDSYRTVFGYENLYRALGVSVLRTVIGSFLTLAVTSMCAYALTKKNLVGYRFFYLFFVTSMFISGGLIPTFLLYQQLGIYNTFWGYILPGAFSAYYMILFRTYIIQLPKGLEEAAFLDGAGEWAVYFRIVLPMSTPMLATVGLFVAVAQWSAWQDTLYYVTNPNLESLQFVLMKVLRQAEATAIAKQAKSTMMRQMRTVNITPDSIKMAITIVATLPILLVYPFLQKYFVKGMVLGAVKE